LDERRFPSDLNACNCIQVSAGRLIGYNTDVIGFSDSLLPLLKPYHKQALVLGQGGASEAVCYVLKVLNIPYKLVGRSRHQLDQFLFDELSDEMVDQHKLIIQTTPLGTYPAMDECPPIPFKAIGSEHLLYDLVYNPARTRFLQRGEERGAVICNGLRMLELQAEASWAIWNGSSSAQKAMFE
jgi:shikimate dehydrogenase